MRSIFGSSKMNRKISSISDLIVIDEDEMIRRRHLIQSAHKRNIGNPKESEMCERFILNFRHPVFRYLLKYKYEYYEGLTNKGSGDIVFSSKKEKKVQDICRSEVLIIEAKFLDRISSGKNQCGKRTKHRKKATEQLNKSMKQWHFMYQKDNIYGSILINEPDNIPVYHLINKQIIIGYLYYAKRWYHLDSFTFNKDEVFNFDFRNMSNSNCSNDEMNVKDENQNSSEDLLLRDTFDEIEIDEEEMILRRRLIDRANKINNGKTIEKESDLCERFILKFKHPKFRYLLEYEYEYYEGLTDKGSGDIVFSSEKKGESLFETREILIIEAKYLDRLSSGRNKCGKRTKHRKKVIEQVNTSMKQWKMKYKCDSIYGSILINETGIKNIYITEFSNNEKIYLSPAKICYWFDSIDCIEYGEFNFDLKTMMTNSDRLNSCPSDDEDNNESDDSFYSLPYESEDENEIDHEEMIRRREIIVLGKYITSNSIQDECKRFECERFILNFKHPKFRYLLEYEYEYHYEGISDWDFGHIVFSSEKTGGYFSETREVLIITKVDVMSYIDDQHEVIKQVNKSIKLWKLEYEKDHIYGSLLTNENITMEQLLGSVCRSIPIFHLKNRETIIGYLSLSKPSYCWDSFDSIEDEIFYFNWKELQNFSSYDPKQTYDD